MVDYNSQIPSSTISLFKAPEEASIRTFLKEMVVETSVAMDDIVVADSLGAQILLSVSCVASLVMWCCSAGTDLMRISTACFGSNSSSSHQAYIASDF
ncbi:hypothetical protein PanWU01x14_233830 [Parasponia andersonii]|uniref:Uncharacterized protein n=1 Tax=Parasponia andersonii TaxID=3476 RepID=A0A2P5BJL0_PARAD|nr:hypothetical protein PanWU01x14_233830 [Parasponia andersonii]